MAVNFYNWAVHVATADDKYRAKLYTEKKANRLGKHFGSNKAVGKKCRNRLA